MEDLRLLSYDIMYNNKEKFGQPLQKPWYQPGR